MWGSTNRSYASIKFFFLYTFTGSILMLVAILYLYNQTGSFYIEKFYGLPLKITFPGIIVLCVFPSPSR